MAENKTRPTKVSVADFLEKKATGQRLADGQELSRLFREVTSAGCLYIKRLEDIDLGVLKRLAAASVAQLRRRYG